MSAAKRQVRVRPMNYHFYWISLYSHTIIRPIIIRCKQRVIVWNKYNHIVSNNLSRCYMTLQLVGRTLKFAMDLGRAKEWHTRFTSVL